MNPVENALQQLRQVRKPLVLDMPSKVMAKQFTEMCFNLLFPISARLSCSSTEEEASVYRLQTHLINLLLPVKNLLTNEIGFYAQEFISFLPILYQKLIKDAEAILNFDPAAESLEEVILAYPGFYAITVYRISNKLHSLKIPIVPRIISELAHNETGIDINPGATIGESFFIDHGTGVVIGETAIIHNNVKIYQGVTLGALQVKKELSATKRHPTVEDNVVIYSGATILGGATVIGHDSIIGGNVWVTSSIPANSVVYHKDEVRIRPQHFDFSNVIDYQI